MIRILFPLEVGTIGTISAISSDKYDGVRKSPVELWGAEQITV